MLLIHVDIDKISISVELQLHTVRQLNVITFPVATYADNIRAGIK